MQYTNKVVLPTLSVEIACPVWDMECNNDDDNVGHRTGCQGSMGWLCWRKFDRHGKHWNDNSLHRLVGLGCNCSRV